MPMAHRLQSLTRASHRSLCVLLPSVQPCTTIHQWMRVGCVVSSSGHIHHLLPIPRASNHPRPRHLPPQSRRPPHPQLQKPPLSRSSLPSLHRVSQLLLHRARRRTSRLHLPRNGCRRCPGRKVLWRPTGPKQHLVQTKSKYFRLQLAKQMQASSITSPSP